MVIGVLTIFLSVMVVTYLDSLINVAPAVTLISSTSTVGDYDLLLQKKDDKDITIKGNGNYY